jgi:Zn-dependent M28 family amino/carboxypeptidase
VVSAHYDHLGTKGSHVFYGADDNATGVATLLAIADKVSKLGLA